MFNFIKPLHIARLYGTFMLDVQKDMPDVAIPIDRVGVRSVRMPLCVRDRANEKQSTVAEVDLTVDLPSSFKGTHMSRFVEALENWEGRISYRAVRDLLASIRERLEARSAQVTFRFPYSIRKKAPVSGAMGVMSYDCVLTGVLDERLKPEFTMEITVPVMTVCPCSKAISDEGAHSQRTLIHMTLLTDGFSWMEDFIELAESSGSSPVYTTLKREDEKYVTEHAFANPCFVEDVVRNVAKRLKEHPHLRGFQVQVESMESIHNHNATASIAYNFS